MVQRSKTSSRKWEREKAPQLPCSLRRNEPPSRIWVVVVVALVTASAFLWVRSAQLPMLRGPHGYVMADPDSYLRWHLVKRAVDGEGVRIRWMTVDNAPYGRMNEWTAPMTIIGVAAVRVAEWIGRMSPQEALRLCGLWLGPVVGLVGLVMLAGLGWRAGGWLLAVCWLLAWPTVGTGTPPNQLCNQFGSVDHHSLHQVLFICMVGGCLARAGGVFVGICSALGMWSGGSELLPVWGFVALLAVWEVGWRGENVTFWRAWWVSGLLSVAAAWVFEFWPDLFHGHLEFISVWHVALWGLCGGLLELLASRQMGAAAKIAAVFVAMALAIVGAGVVRGFDWSHLHVAQDPVLQRQMVDTVECRSLFSQGLWQGIATFVGNYGLLVLLLPLAAGRVSQLDVRVRWALVVTLLLLVLSSYEERWGDFFVVVLVMTAGMLLQERWWKRPWLCAMVMLVATLPPWWQAVEIHAEARKLSANPMSGPYGTAMVMEVVSACLEREGEPPVVLAEWSQGGFLAGMEKVHVVGSGYWSNLQGLKDGYELFSTSSEQRFWELVKQRRVEFFFRPPPELLAEAIGNAFRVIGGGTATMDRIKQTVIWRVASSGDIPVVACPELARLAPACAILRLESVHPGKTDHPLGSKF